MNELITKAIIPIAGLGTRMFPQTYFTKKALLPLVDSEGIVKPALMYMLEELIEAQVEDIYLIVGCEEESEYKKLFHFEEDNELRKKLPVNIQEQYDVIRQVGQKVHFVVQREKKGFGHAVFQARKYLDGQPAILLLGDFVYRSSSDISCTQQTINAYSQCGGKAVVSIKKIPFSESNKYGVIHGKFLPSRPFLMDVDRMVEKPGEGISKMELSVDGSCYATFGQYILTEEVFQFLEQEIKQQDEFKQKEVDITSALMNEAKKGNLIGVSVCGESFDIGMPELYYNTFVTFRNN